ncbi:hypothetical protein LP419_30490 [Massilia sp. H-1]|nr:hypothetical protein LP419_30490 [Massilia sp. H-1]
MLLELNWNSGKLVREYTFLLDPAEIRSGPASASDRAGRRSVARQEHQGPAPGAKHLQLLPSPHRRHRRPHANQVMHRSRRRL